MRLPKISRRTDSFDWPPTVHILAKMHRVGKWMSWVTRHMHQSYSSHFEGNMNNIVPLDVIATFFFHAPFCDSERSPSPLGVR